MAEVRHVKISDICNIEKGTTGLAKAIPGRYPLVTTGAECRTSRSYQFDSKAACIPLVSSTGHGKKSLNYVHYQEGKFALGSILAAVIPINNEVVNARYLHVYLQKNKDRVIVPLMRGAANVSLSIKAISNIEIPLPSLKKQEKTLKKIDSISEEHEDFQQEINIQAGLYKRLRQQILQEAIEGKLTVTWRKNNPQLISGENHASRVIERIIAKKDELVEKGEIRKEKSLSVLNNVDKPFDLPDGWAWSRYSCLFLFIDYRGVTPTKIKKGVRLITAKNVRSGCMNLQPEEFISKKEYDARMIRGFPATGDIFFTTEAPLGNVCLMDFPEKELISPGQRIITFQPYDKKSVLSKFFMYQIMSPFMQQYLQDKSTGMTAKGIKAATLKQMLIIVPPLAEQQAIVKRVDKLMHMIDMLEVQGTERKEQSEMLMQSVLQEAFEVEV